MSGPRRSSMARHEFVGSGSRILEVTNLWGSGHRMCRSYVVDIGCGSCGLWSHGFVRRMVGLGWEMKGFSVSVWASGSPVHDTRKRALAHHRARQRYNALCLSRTPGRAAKTS